MSPRPDIPPFVVKDCALASIATGRRAQNLRELRDQIATVDAASIYYHFWGCLMWPRFDDPEYNNDIAAWVGHAIGEHALAERLAVIDPARYSELEALRREVLEVIDDHLDQVEHPAWARRDERFQFCRAQTVVFDTGRQFTTPEQLGANLPGLSTGSVFYHFIDARRRPPQRMDDFRVWLANFGDDCAELVAAIGTVDPYFTRLTALRAALAEAFRAHSP